MAELKEVLAGPPSGMADQDLDSGIIGRFNDAVRCIHPISNRLLNQYVNRPSCK